MNFMCNVPGLRQLVVGLCALLGEGGGGGLQSGLRQELGVAAMTRLIDEYRLCLVLDAPLRA